MNGYRRISMFLSAAIVVLGVTMIVVTLANGGGQLGLILGVLFICAGAARLYVLRGR